MSFGRSQIFLCALVGALGFTDELKRADLPADILTGSTEENFPTVMTGVGTAGIGYCPGPFTS